MRVSVGKLCEPRNGTGPLQTRYYVKLNIDQYRVEIALRGTSGLPVGNLSTVIEWSVEGAKHESPQELG
jgi:hypothetical protein